jgi:small subunit ribosomal protein S16
LAVRIRLRRMGAKKRPFYRFVATESRYARDGRFIETLGYYNPIETPAKVKVEEEKIFKWLKDGAQMSETVASIFRQINLLDKFEKIQAGESGDGVQIKSEIRERRKRRKKAKAAAELTEETTEESAESSDAPAETEKPAETESNEASEPEAAEEDKS